MSAARCCGVLPGAPSCPQRDKQGRASAFTALSSSASCAAPCVRQGAAPRRAVPRPAAPPHDKICPQSVSSSRVVLCVGPATLKGFDPETICDPQRGSPRARRRGGGAYPQQGACEQLVHVGRGLVPPREQRSPHSTSKGPTPSTGNNNTLPVQRYHYITPTAQYRCRGAPGREWLAVPPLRKKEPGAPAYSSSHSGQSRPRRSHSQRHSPWQGQTKLRTNNPGPN